MKEAIGRTRIVGPPPQLQRESGFLRVYRGPGSLQPAQAAPYHCHRPRFSWFSNCDHFRRFRPLDRTGLPVGGVIDIICSVGLLVDPSTQVDHVRIAHYSARLRQLSQRVQPCLLPQSTFPTLATGRIKCACFALSGRRSGTLWWSTT